jgi:hypothetical protein
MRHQPYLEVSTLDNRDVHVVRRWAEIFELLAGENISGNKMDLGVTVLSGLEGKTQTIRNTQRQPQNCFIHQRLTLEVDMSMILQGRFLITT